MPDLPSPDRSVFGRLSAVVAEVLGDVPVRIRGWDGSVAGPAGAPVVVLRSRTALRRLLWDPDELGLARAYVAGEIDLEGDLADGLSRVRAVLRSRPPVLPGWRDLPQAGSAAGDAPARGRMRLGSLILYAAEHHGVHATGVTISAQQRDHVEKLIAERGLADRVSVRLQDYREVPVPADGPYDAVASIEMSEHVRQERPGRAGLAALPRRRRADVRGEPDGRRPAGARAPRRVRSQRHAGHPQRLGGLLTMP